MPYRNPCIFYTHLAFSYSVGPASVVWSELGPAPPFPPMRVQEVQWSRALSLMCELALTVLLEDLTTGIRCGTLACSASTASFVIHKVTIVCVSELCMLLYLYILCHKLILAYLWNEVWTSNVCEALCDRLQFFYLEDVLEWHMARLLVRNGYWNTHATMRLEDYVLIHVDIVLGFTAIHNMERENMTSEGEGKIVFMALTSAYEFCSSTPDPKACKMTNFVIRDG